VIDTVAAGVAPMAAALCSDMRRMPRVIENWATRLVRRVGGSRGGRNFGEHPAPTVTSGGCQRLFELEQLSSYFYSVGS
jgi:hypothetical protein